MSISIDNRRPRDRDATSAGLHREHPLDVPAHGHQIPLALEAFEPSQQALATAHHRFDDAEHRLRGLLAQPVQCFPAWRVQSIRHLLQRRGRVGRGFRSRGKALLPRQVMAAAPQGNQRLDARSLTALDVRLAQIPIVREDDLGAAQFLGQSPKLLDHRQELLFVVGRLGDFRGHDQHAAGRHKRLRVVALIKAATADLHDARLFIRQIDLVLVTHPASGRFGRGAARLLTGAPLLLGSRRQLALMLGLLARQTLRGPRLDLGLRLGNRRQPHLTPFQLLGNRHPVGNIPSIRPLGKPQQLLHFPLQLLLDLLRVPVGQRAVPARIGVHLRAIQSHSAELEHSQIVRQLQHLDEQRLELRQEALAKVRDRIVVGMLITGDIAKRHRVVRRTLNRPAGKGLRGVPVHQQPEQDRRVIRRRARTAIRFDKFGSIEFRVGNAA